MEVAKYFDKTADAFDSLYRDENSAKDRLNRILRKGIYDRALMTARRIEDLEKPTVLDVGCGSGRNSVLFVKSGARSLVGIDFADRMLELATSFAKKHGVEDRCSFINADFLQYDTGNKFDAVVALGVFDYVEEPIPFLDRMRETSKGLVIASFPGYAPVRSTLRKVRYALKGCPLYFYSRRRLARAASEAGFDQFEIVPYASAGYLLVADVRVDGSQGSQL